MSYLRVLPRDAFNEANLLKCIGKLTLLIEEKTINWRYEFKYPDEGFIIEQDESDGSIFVSNLYFYDESGEEMGLHRPLNSRESWPLMDKNYSYIFNDKGEVLA